jgi:hypothetical protein
MPHSDNKYLWFIMYFAYIFQIVFILPEIPMKVIIWIKVTY